MLSEVDWLCDEIKGKIFDKVKNEMFVTACNVVFTSESVDEFHSGLLFKRKLSFFTVTLAGVLTEEYVLRGMNTRGLRTCQPRGRDLCRAEPR